jgi:hypothetical protein
VPLDHGRWLYQHHHLQRAWPQSLKPDPQQVVDREKPGPTWPLATQNLQLVRQREVLQFHNRPTTESAYEAREDRSHDRKHAGDITAVHPKSLQFL